MLVRTQIELYIYILLYYNILYHILLCYIILYDIIFYVYYVFSFSVAYPHFVASLSIDPTRFVVAEMVHRPLGPS